MRSIIRLKDLSPTIPVNISTRMNVQTGENVMIGGFIIPGDAPKKVIVRALGTSLLQSGVVGALADPMLELRGTSGLIASNDTWEETQEAQVRASGVAPASDPEPAIVATLQPGNYTAIVRGHVSEPQELFGHRLHVSARVAALRHDYELRRRGGIGRRARLKIWYS